MKLKRLFMWLYPGIGVKRWIMLCAFGVILLMYGSSGLRSEDYVVLRVLDLVVLASGIIILILGIKHLMTSFINAVIPPSRENGLVDILYQRKQLSRGPKIVAIGGGTGLATLLTGLKEYSSNISAIVTVADDGGSSGRLRQQFDILPPGDIRNCLVALADASTMMRDLFQYRFEEGSELAGHSFGNLFITVMTRLTGDFEKAIRETSKVLALRGQVIPSTLDNVVLVAEHKDGTITEGENRIPLARRPIKRVQLSPGKPQPAPEAIKAIEEADIIVLGPGSLYTSILPNLLIREITDAIVASKGIKIYVCNVMTQPGETEEYCASAHVKALIEHSSARIIDYCVVNTGKIPAHILKRYEGQSSFPVANDSALIENAGYRVLGADIISIAEDMVRHDPLKLAGIINGLIEEV
ncbi:MAG: gluconeogenesis factor YvcK family protein [Deltaproteobacteria bacterium]